MRVHSKEKIEVLRELRTQGLSIGELMIKMQMPKTTIWHHVHELELSEESLKILKAKQGGSTRREQRNWEDAKERAANLLKGPHRDSVVALAMLYWAEGNKKKGCNFVNTDGNMIFTYLLILRKVLNIPEPSIMPTLRIFTGMDGPICLAHWSKITKIPADRFKVYLNDGGSRGRSPFGMCRITISKAGKGGNILKLIHSVIRIFSAEIAEKFS
jgi:hypothetical protein